MSAVKTPSEGRVTQTWSDVVISSVVLIVTSAALMATIGWPPAAALFPRIASIIGIVCSAGYLLTILVQRLRSNPASPKTSSEADPAPDNEEEDTQDNLGGDYVFATAGRRAWVISLGWISLFLILMYLFGIFVAGAILALLYLRFSAGHSWLFAAVYAVSLTLVLWGLFDNLLQAALPRGILEVF